MQLRRRRPPATSLSAPSTPSAPGADRLDEVAALVDVGAAAAALAPADEAATLSAWLREGGYLGWCNSALADSDECEPLDALRSPVTGQCVDLRSAPLAATAAAGAGAVECREPAGGQRACRGGKGVEVSFILTLHDNDALAAKSLLELFRTAQVWRLSMAAECGG
eukprot:86396-Chlamydomonas_euryale.AAC.1